MSQSSLACSSPAAAGTSVYRISRASRKVDWVLLIGATFTWLFAAWTIYTLLTGGIELGEIVPLALMSGLILVTPFLIWNIMEEMESTFAVNGDGLIYRAPGVAVICPWDKITGISEARKEGFWVSEGSSVNFSGDCMPASSNSLTALLHRQAHGLNRLRLYASIEGREELQEYVRSHIGNS
jgi:hypothetical protein